MKYIFLLMFIAVSQICSTSNASEELLEKVSLRIQPDVVVELSAKEIPASDRKNTNGLCIYQGQLWEPAMTNPPWKIMVSGYITIGNTKIKLDVSGLATPWIHPSEMTKDDCRLRKYNMEEDDPFYILDVCFFKGGALDYMVTWLIYKDKSLRQQIVDVGDVYPDWYKKEEIEE